jgi:hypothetical protein
MSDPYLIPGTDVLRNNIERGVPSPRASVIIFSDIAEDTMGLYLVVPVNSRY